MRKEEIKRIKLIADNGKVLTDGNAYGKEIFLSTAGDTADWHEISETEYEEIQRANEKEPELKEVIQYEAK